jgi:hypothetical protein
MDTMPTSPQEVAIEAAVRRDWARYRISRIGPFRGRFVGSLLPHAFAPERRRRTLSFRHHVEVASLPASTADELLDWCETNGAKRPRTVLELRLEILRRPSAENPTPGSESLAAEEKPSAKLRETGEQAPLEQEPSGQEPLRESAPGQVQTSLPTSLPLERLETLGSITSGNNLQLAENRYDELLRMLRSLRDDPPDPVAVANLAVREDLRTLTAVMSFFRSFYQRLQERLPGVQAQNQDGRKSQGGLQ